MARGDEARARDRGGGVLLGVDGHERTGVVGERMRVRSRQRGDQGWIVPTAGAVLPTAEMACVPPNSPLGLFVSPVVALFAAIVLHYAPVENVHPVHMGLR